MCSGSMLVTHPNGRQQAIPLKGGILRIGSALDNDLVLSGPGSAPHHATIRCDDYGDLLITIGGQDARMGGASLEIELPRAFAPAALVRIGGYVLSYRPDERKTKPLEQFVLRSGEAGWSAALESADDETLLLRELLGQHNLSAEAELGEDISHEAVTIEMPAFTGMLLDD